MPPISRSRIPALALAACLLTLVACGEDSTGPAPEVPSGSLGFSYSGPMTGTFAASGQYGQDRTGSFVWRPFALGVRYFDESAGRQSINLFSVAPLNDSRANSVDIFLDDASQPRTLSLDFEACVLDRATLVVREGCAVGIFAFNAAPQSGTGEFWLTNTGTLRVTAVADGRMQGTFSGTLINEDDDILTITGGTFDVPLVNQDDLARRSRAPAA